MNFSRPILPYAWFVVSLLWPVALLNYLDRQMLASMQTSVMADIPTIVNDTNWGYMLGQFKWVYAFLSPLGGYVADRYSRRFTISASLFVWSAVTWATGHVETYDALLLWTRTLMNLVSISCGGLADWGFGALRDREVPINVIFSVFASTALVSIGLVLLIRVRRET